MTNRKGCFGLALAVALTTAVAVAQTKRPAPPATQPQKQQVVEVTKEDFLTMPKVVSTNLSTFGVSLGMTREQAMEALKSFCPLCSMTSDDRDSGQFWLRTQDHVSARIHFDKQGEIEEVAWADGMQQYLVGQSSKLFNSAAYTKDSALRLELLGREDSRTPEIDDASSSGSVTQTTFVYGKEGLRLNMMVIAIASEHTATAVRWVILTKPAKAR